MKDIDLRNTCVFTNTTPVAAYRGAGRPEAAYYLERLVDCIAADGQAAVPAAPAGGVRAGGVTAWERGRRGGGARVRGGR